jgi:6-phosphogluconolactonase (cycloisomerase 2 family)
VLISKRQLELVQQPSQLEEPTSLLISNAVRIYYPIRNIAGPVFAMNLKKKDGTLSAADIEVIDLNKYYFIKLLNVISP